MNSFSTVFEVAPYQLGQTIHQFFEFKLASKGLGKCLARKAGDKEVFIEWYRELSIFLFKFKLALKGLRVKVLNLSTSY